MTYLKYLVLIALVLLPSWSVAGTLPTDAAAQPVRPIPSGGAYYSIQRVNITTGSVNLPFGFLSKKVLVRAASTNTDDLCLDWLGGTAVCPAANTAGNTRLLPGLAILLDDFAVTSLSIIAASGTQQVNITAWGP